MSLMPDKPLSIPEGSEKCPDDIFGRQELAKRIATEILQYASDETLTIGINGPWGVGKSSLLNFIEHYLQSVPFILSAGRNGALLDGGFPIVIRFPLWNLINTEEIVARFFNVVVERINVLSKIKKRRITSSFIKTISVLLHISGLITDSIPGIPTIAGKTLTNICKTFDSYREAVLKEEQSKDLWEQKQSLIQALCDKSFRYRFVVVIDDFDRLNQTEIRAVFQLIKAVMDLPKFTYILAFDKNIVAPALAPESCQKNELAGFDYLKKFIQTEHRLWNFDVSVIRDYLEGQIEKHLSVYNLSYNRDLLGRFIISGLFNRITTIRDAKRFINFLSFELEQFVSEIDWAELVAFSYLRFIHPKTDSIMLDYHSFLLGDKSFLSEEKKKEEAEFFKAIESLELDVDARDYFWQIFPYMFSHSSVDKVDKYSSKKIRNPSKFRLLFAQFFSPYDIPQDRLDKAFNVMSVESINDLFESLASAQTESFLSALTKTLSMSKTTNYKDIYAWLWSHWRFFPIVDRRKTITLSVSLQQAFIECASGMDATEYVASMKAQIGKAKDFDTVFLLRKIANAFSERVSGADELTELIDEKGLELLRAGFSMGVPLLSFAVPWLFRLDRVVFIQALKEVDDGVLCDLCSKFVSKPRVFTNGHVYNNYSFEWASSDEPFDDEIITRLERFIYSVPPNEKTICCYTIVDAHKNPEGAAKSDEGINEEAIIRALSDGGASD